MSYLAISDESARLWWDTWRRGCEEGGERAAIPTPPNATPRNEHDKKDHAKIARSLVERVDQLLEKRGTDEIPSNDRFEAEAAVIMFDELGLSDPVSDPEFWIWMAVEPGACLISKRYPGTEANLIPNRTNFASPNARETYFYRLWARGHLGYDAAAKDPYALARSGDIDFWRSHILRQSLTEAGSLRHALIRFQYPHGAASSPNLSTPKIRKLIKRLKRTAANINVEMLNHEQAEHLIRREWCALKEAADNES